MAEKYAIVAVHDATPKYLDKIPKIDDFLKKEGIDDFSYLIIPKFRGKDSQEISEHESFADIMEGTGQELVMHGYTHSNLLIEDEFFTNYKNAWHKILQARRIFKRCFGYVPKGFIPPMWAISKGALKAVKDAGFEYTSSNKYFYDFRAGVRLRSTLVIRGNIMSVPSTFNTIFRRKPLVEVALHPQDTLLKRELLKLLIDYLKKKGYTFLSYESFLDKL
jgi:predicted deacetylase